MRKILLALAAVASSLPLWGGEASAQTATVIPGNTCPVTSTLQVGSNQPLLETQNGALCTNATGSGGSGGPITAGDGAIAGIGLLADPLYTGSGSASTIALLKGVYNAITTGALPSGNNVIGSIAANTTGGASYYTLHGGTTASTNSNLIKNAAGTLYTLSAINTTATVYYLHLYDAAVAPTCTSTSNIAHTYPIPAGSGFVASIPVAGEAYTAGIGYCVTANGADGDNTAAVTGIYINASFK